MEDYIQSNISNVLALNKTKDIVFNYFSANNFDVENEVNILLIKNLYTKLDEMKKEFNIIMNDKNLFKRKLENSLKNMEKRAMKGRPTKEMAKTKNELDNINEEIYMLEMNCKKKEALFNKYLIILRSKCNKHSEQSYFENNPVLVDEVDYDESFKNDVIFTIENVRIIS